MNKIFLVSIIASLSHFSFGVSADESPESSRAEAEANLQHYTQNIEAWQTVIQGGKFSRAAAQYYNNTDKAKIEILFGKWQLQYKDTSLQSDTLELDSTENDTNFGYYGWDGKHRFSCFYEPKMIGTIYSYQCLHLVDTNTGIAQHYLFNLNGNSLSGKYFSGTVSQFLEAIKNNKLLDLSGNKSVSVSVNDSDYDDNSKILRIPKVSAFGNTYSVTLLHEGNGNFKLKTIDPL
jgi:hypothetical protein